jgi:hypothetical protein
MQLPGFESLIATGKEESKGKDVTPFDSSDCSYVELFINVSTIKPPPRFPINPE